MDFGTLEYKSSYSKPELRGVDLTPRPPLGIEIAQAFGGKEKRLLDIGCGNAQKTITLAPFYADIVGIDPSIQLLKQAQDNISKANVQNISVVEGASDLKPLLDVKFDVITNILAFLNPEAARKILKKDGTLIVEWLGVDDKVTFTRLFGRDRKGWRGANVGKTYEQHVEELKEKLVPHFEVEKIYNQTWRTRYTPAGLWLLLNNTYSTVRDFDPLEDQKRFDEACKQLNKDGTIELTQNRIIMVAKPV